jgi:hypothetical protein
MLAQEIGDPGADFVVIARTVGEDGPLLWQVPVGVFDGVGVDAPGAPDFVGDMGISAGIDDVQHEPFAPIVSGFCFVERHS